MSLPLCTICGKELSETEIGLSLNFLKPGYFLHQICWPIGKNVYSKKYVEKKIKVRIKSSAELIAEREQCVMTHLLFNPCSRCGVSDPLVLTFHHVLKQDKLADISELVSHGTLWQLQTEIKKCVVLCWNCHHRQHAIERGTWRLKYVQN